MQARMENIVTIVPEAFARKTFTRADCRGAARNAD